MNINDMIELFPFRDRLIASEVKLVEWQAFDDESGNKFTLAYRFENGYGISILGCDNYRVAGIYAEGGLDSFEVAMIDFNATEQDKWLVANALNRHDTVLGYQSRDDVESIMVFIKNYKQGDIYGQIQVGLKLC